MACVAFGAVRRLGAGSADTAIALANDDAGIYATGVMKWGPLEMLFFGILLSVLAVLGVIPKLGAKDSMAAAAGIDRVAMAKPSESAPSVSSTG